MEFKHQSLVKDFALHRTQRSILLRLPYEGRFISAVLRHQRKNEFASKTPSNWAVADLTLVLDVKSITETCLKESAAGLVPRFSQLMKKGGGEVRQQLGHIANADGTLKPNREMDFWLLPEAVQEEISSIRELLRNKTALVIDTIRWRQALDGPHQPQSNMRLYWSELGSTWHEVPGGLSTSVSVHNALGHSRRWKADVQRLLNKQLSPPAAYDLLREAQELRSTSPRSGLVIGIAAAEIAVKQCIANLVPDAEWLAFEYQGVTVDAILKNYISSIMSVNDGAVKKELDSLRKIIKKAVEKRNQVVHRAGSNVSPREVKTYLDAIDRLIRLLDGVSSYPWALKFLYLETPEDESTNRHVRIRRTPM